MVMGMMISRLGVRATCEDEGEDEFSEALKRRGSIRMRGAGRGDNARPYRVQVVTWLMALAGISDCDYVFF